MIPYDELVVALQAWRAKQGLPISQMSGQLSMPPPAAAAPAPAPVRGAPPAPPKAPPRAPSAHEEVDAAMLEEAYEPDGGDFAMNFGNNADGDEATAIGGAPAKPEYTDPTGRGGGRKQGW